jgi:sugar transferase (PEP-CTERM/EpsH1 system associated)
LTPAVLLVAHRVPHPPDKGEKIRTFHVLQALAEQFTVHLVALADAAVPPASREALAALCRSVDLFPVPSGRAVAAAKAIAAGRSVSETYFRVPEAFARIAALARGKGLAAALASSSATAPYVTGLPGVAACVDFMDVDSDKWAQYAGRAPDPARRWLYRREQRLVAALEEDAVAKSAAVFVTTSHEKELLAATGGGVDNVVVVGNGVDVERFTPAAGEGEEVVFLGAMDYAPNVDAATWFCREVWPGVRATRPAARFVIVGSDPAPEVRALERVEGVHVTGRVARVEPHLETARLMVVPVRMARGVQNKVLEGMAAGLPVVTTPAGAEGIEAKAEDELIVRGDAAGMTRAVCDLLADPARCRRVGAQARRRMVEDYSWERRLAPMLAAIGEAVTKR